MNSSPVIRVNVISAQAIEMTKEFVQAMLEVISVTNVKKMLMKHSISGGLFIKSGKKFYLYGLSSFSNCKCVVNDVTAWHHHKAIRYDSESHLCLTLLVNIARRKPEVSVDNWAHLERTDWI